MLPPFNLPKEILLLITDELSSPADFVLHKSLTEHLKESKNATAVVLSVSEDLARWKSIASKSNLNLSQALSSGKLAFIDVLSHVQPEADTGSNVPQLKPILDELLSCLRNFENGSTLVILDDISSLEWIGFSLLDITRFTRAIRAACSKAKATLLIRHHIVTPDELDDLFRHLLQICSFHMDVRPLASGRSGSVSGEIALHTRLCATSDNVKLLPRSLAIQYRLTETGPIFFERGTGGGVL